MQTLQLLPLIPLIPSILAYKPAYNHARQIPQSQIAPRTYNGGWALSLPGTTCPPDASVSCGTNDDTVNPTCCPSGQTCFGLTTPHCCPGNTDCTSPISNFPVCANSTWNLYVLSASERAYFCCEEGQIGVLPITGYAGLCEPPDQAVASSLIATPYTTGVGSATGGAGHGATSTGKAGATPTSGSSSASTGTTTSGSSASYGKKFKLSIGEIVGIAIAGLALVTVLLLIAFCCLRRNKRTQSNYTGYAPPPVHPAPAYDPPPQQYGQFKVGNGGRNHVGGGYVEDARTPSPMYAQGPYAPPVEAPVPQRWENRAEIMDGR